jgi:hypothetical protein
MKTKSIAVLIMVLTFSIAGSHAQTPRKELDDKGIKPLKTEQLKTFLPGNTVYHINPANGFRVPLLYVPDGTRYVKIKGQVSKTTWRIERDMVCEESVVLKREVCRTLYHGQGTGAVCDEGSDTCAYGLDWVAGNPEKLGN